MNVREKSELLFRLLCDGDFEWVWLFPLEMGDAPPTSSARRSQVANAFSVALSMTSSKSSSNSVAEVGVGGRTSTDSFRKEGCGPVAIDKA